MRQVPICNAVQNPLDATGNCPGHRFDFHSAAVFVCARPAGAVGHARHPWDTNWNVQRCLLAPEQAGTPES